MKKKVTITSIILTFILIGAFVSINLKKKELSFSTSNTPEQIAGENTLSMMLETESGSGEYEKVTRSAWPTDGYIFNENLSYCDKGSTISWNEETSSITYHGRLSDKCYVYFDKYSYAVINGVSYSATTSSLTVTVTATKGTYDVVKYYFSNDDGATYQESNTNSYTFSGLSSGTSYSIKVYVVDSNGKSSGVTTKTVSIDSYVSPIIKSVTASSTTSSITVNVSATNGTNYISTYFYSINGGSSYVSSKSSSYTFSSLSSGTSYSIKVYVVDSNGKSSSFISKIVGTASPYPISNYCTSGTTLANCVKTYANQGTSISNVYIHNSSLTNGAGDDSYRFAGANPNNYVCIGSTASSCPNANLFRIIGVFDNQIKVIKAESIGSFLWNSGGSNVWSSSSLKTYLNGTYLSNISSFSSKIATATWKVCGATSYYLTPLEMYTKEITNCSAKTVSAKIGLMYASDYGFAASPSAWTIDLLYYSGNDTSGTDIKTIDWLYLGSGEWLITPSSDTAFFVSSVGNVGNLYTGGLSESSENVRPVFYLNSSVTYASGDGTSSSPIRLS